MVEFYDKNGLIIDEKKKKLTSIISMLKLFHYEFTYVAKKSQIEIKTKKLVLRSILSVRKYYLALALPRRIILTIVYVHNQIRC